MSSQCRSDVVERRTLAHIFQHIVDVSRSLIPKKGSMKHHSLSNNKWKHMVNELNWFDYFYTGRLNQLQVKPRKSSGRPGSSAVVKGKWTETMLGVELTGGPFYRVTAIGAWCLHLSMDWLVRNVFQGPDAFFSKSERQISLRSGFTAVVDLNLNMIQYSSKTRLDLGSHQSINSDSFPLSVIHTQRT